MDSNPSDDELIEFAATLLGDRNDLLTAPEVLRETVGGARDLWVQLYRASRPAEEADA